MKADPEAAIMHKCRELILLLNIHLNHFPKHEKYGLCQTIRNCVYGVLGLIVECQKRYHNKTSLTKLDVQHEQLRAFVNLASIQSSLSHALHSASYHHFMRKIDEASLCISTQ